MNEKTNVSQESLPGGTKLITWQTLRRTLAILVLLLLCAAGYLAYWANTGRFLAVEKGQLYRSAALSAGKLARICQRYGIRTVLDFRTEKDKVEEEANELRRLGIRHVNLPSAQVPTPETVEAFLDIMDNTDNRPVLIHCTHGVGRTGVFAAIYRMEYLNWTPERALREVRLISGFDSFERGSPKELFLRSYKPRRSVAELKARHGP